MSRKIATAILCLILFVLVINRNTTYYRTPKFIEADGEQLIACKGIVSVTSEGSPPTYSIAYIDQGGANVYLYGIHKLEIVDTRSVGDPARCHQ